MSALSSTLLGYPDDARLLLVSCDDLGMHVGVNEAVLDAVRRGVATSTSVMAPCPAAEHAFALLRQTPDVPFGIHLTLTRDGPVHRWRPVSPPSRVPSLVDDEGLLRLGAQASALLDEATLEDVETELRAQVELVDRAGLVPTHLDWHVVADGGREDLTELTLALAAEHGLAARMWLDPARARLRAGGRPVVDHRFLDSFTLPLEGKTEHYLRLLRDLPAGLSEWAVHPAMGRETPAEAGLGWDVRRSDHAFLVSPQAAAAVAQEGIVLLDYRGVRDVWAQG